MALETRQRGGVYYYRSRREGDRVVKEYVGGGRAAELMAAIDMRERAERQAKADARRAATARIDAADAEIDDLHRRVELLVRATLLGAGYHRHDRGDWRKRRGNHG